MLGDRSRSPDLLIEHLHLVQDTYGYLGAAHLQGLICTHGQVLIRPDGRMDLVPCRNLGFTCFDECRQRELLRRIAATMHDGAALVLGAHEHLPDDAYGVCAWFEEHAIYRSESAVRRPAN